MVGSCTMRMTKCVDTIGVADVAGSVTNGGRFPEESENASMEGDYKSTVWEAAIKRKNCSIASQLRLGGPKLSGFWMKSEEKYFYLIPPISIPISIHL